VPIIEFKRRADDEGDTRGQWRPTWQTWVVFAFIAAIVACFTLTIPSLSHAAILH
jgi:hypothetical protein